MSRISVWLIYSATIVLAFLLSGRFPEGFAWVASGTMGSGSALFIHWLCNRNFD